MTYLMISMPGSSRLIALALAFVCLGGCANPYHSEDFERHKASQLVVPIDSTGVFYYDVAITPSYPDGDPLAEQRRMEWLNSWLETRKMCPDGHEILERRPFRFEEDNPGHFDLRYEVRCIVGPASGDS